MNYWLTPYGELIRCGVHFEKGKSLAPLFADYAKWQAENPATVCNEFLHSKGFLRIKCNPYRVYGKDIVIPYISPAQKKTLKEFAKLNNIEYNSLFEV